MSDTLSCGRNLLLPSETGSGQSSAGPFPARLGTSIESGGTAPVAIELPAELPAGPWQATLTLRSGTVERSATARITFPLELGAATEPVAATPVGPLQRRGVVGPVAGVLILLVGFALLASAPRRAATPRRARPRPVRG